MKRNLKFYLIIFITFFIFNEIQCRRGGSFSRSSRIGSKSSGHWFSGLFGGSKSSSSSSPSANLASSSTPLRVNSNLYRGAAPPPYPGLQNRPIYYGKNPPPYSSLDFNANKYYGNSFGNRGLPRNTYIYHNYYGNTDSVGNTGFLTNALYYSTGMHLGYSMGHKSSLRRDWTEDDDRMWRVTTKAPYFENKVPGKDKILPASAVVGAATAFGLVSLLPLNVPPSKPLMYCNNTDLAQSPIRINNGYVYYCFNNTIEILCPPEMFKNVNENFNIVETSTLQPSEVCMKRAMLCDTNDNIYCNNGVLLSRNFIFCNSTTLLNGTNENETTTLLNCYEGEISPQKASFIPTTTTEAPTTTEKSLSFGAKAHVFFLKLIGKSDVLERSTTTTTQAPKAEWIPEALTIQPETTTLSSITDEGSFEWMEISFTHFENGTFGTTLRPVFKPLLDSFKKMTERMGDKPFQVPSGWIKVYKTDATRQLSIEKR